MKFMLFHHLLSKSNMQQCQTMVKSKLSLLRQSAKQVHPQGSSEALKYVQNSLLSLYFLPNITLTPHINSFVRNPLSYNISLPS